MASSNRVGVTGDHMPAMDSIAPLPAVFPVPGTVILLMDDERG